MPASPITVFVASAGTGATIALDWMTGGPTTCMLTAGSTTGASGGRLEMTLQDITLSSTAVLIPIGSSQSVVQWMGLSSQGQTAFLSTIASSGFLITQAILADTRLIYTFTVPLAGLRFNCSGFSSGGIRMDITQGRGY